MLALQRRLKYVDCINYTQPKLSPVSSSCTKVIKYENNYIAVGSFIHSILKPMLAHTPKHMHPRVIRGFGELGLSPFLVSWTTFRFEQWFINNSLLFKNDTWIYPLCPIFSSSLLKFHLSLTGFPPAPLPHRYGWYTNTILRTSV